MQEIQDVISLPHIPIGLIRPKGRETTFADVSKFLSKNPGPFQKVTYLTLGGFVAALCGAVTALVSKAGSTFGGFLALVGLAVVGAGYHFSPSQVKDTKVEVATPDKKDQVTPDPKAIEEAKIKELTEKLFSEKDYKKRKEAVEELIEIGGDTVINILLQHLDKEKTVRVKAVIVSGLGKIGNASCLETLSRISTSETENNGVKEKAGAAILEISSRLPKDAHTTDVEARHSTRINPVIIPEQD